VDSLRSRTRSFNVVLVWFALAACWLVLIWAMGRGYEFSDDANYLIWDATPRSYSWSVSEFGFLWHPLYQLVGGDIRLFRIAGAILLSGSAGIFGWSISRFIASRLPRSSAPVLVVSMMTASFWGFAWWIPSPGYNELNLIGLLLFMAALILAARAIQTTEIVAFAALAALGLTLTAFAKAVSALAALIMGLLWLLLLRPRRPVLFTLVASGCGLAFLMLGIVWIDGDPSHFIRRKLVAVQLLQLISSGHSVAHIFLSTIDPVIDLQAHAAQSLPLLEILAAGFVWSILLLWVDVRYAAWKGWLNIVAAVALAAIVAVWRADGALTPRYHVALIAPLVLTISAGLSLLTRFRRDEGGAYVRPIVALAFLSLCATVSFSLGTDNKLIFHGSQAAVFWFAALVLLAAAAPAASRDDLVSGAALMGSLLTVGMLIGATANPYRLLAPIWQQTVPVSIGAARSPLLVDEVTARYIDTLQDAANAHGFAFGTPVINLTGDSPGTVFALGGTTLGRPWLNGGYPGSTDHARGYLRLVDQSQLRRAWILTGPDTSEATIPADSVLQSLGLDFPGGYRAVGKACKGNPCVEHTLWMPQSPGG
jgi:hypothetical protein